MKKILCTGILLSTFSMVSARAASDDSKQLVCSKTSVDPATAKYNGKILSIITLQRDHGDQWSFLNETVRMDSRSNTDYGPFTFGQLAESSQNGVRIFSGKISSIKNLEDTEPSAADRKISFAFNPANRSASVTNFTPQKETFFRTNWIPGKPLGGYKCLRNGK